MKACFMLVNFEKADICCKFFDGPDCKENVEAMKELAATLGADPAKMFVCYDGNTNQPKSAKPSVRVKKVKPARADKFPGVGFHKQSGKWRAYGTYDGKYKYIGQYDSQEQAIEGKKLHDSEWELKKKQDQAIETNCGLDYAKSLTWWECKKCSYEFAGEPPFTCPKCGSVEFVKTGRPIKQY